MALNVNFNNTVLRIPGHYGDQRDYKLEWKFVFAMNKLIWGNKYGIQPYRRYDYNLEDL